MTEWFEKPVDAASVDALADAGYPRLLARLLALRQVTSETAEAYFAPALRDLAGPEGLPGVGAAVEAILAAVRVRRKIVVFGDYDCDGVCATAILVRTLEALKASVVPFLPERLTEGYGMSGPSLARLLAEQPDVGLVVTVDNGINAVEQVAELKKRGIPVVVTDHHLPGPELPDCPVVNPKVAASAELEGLCGAGVAFLVAKALIDHAKAEGLYSGGSLAAPLLVLAGLATVTDIMPLRGQNRILVVSALRLFRKAAPIGLRELLDRASRFVTPTLGARDFGFLIGPRINAAGRMGSGMDALRLVLADDREASRELARTVDQANVQRKNVEQTMTDKALAQIVPGAAAQVIDLPNGHPGVAGIVAARILERLATGGGKGPVPVCVVVGGHGSARAPDGYNVRDAFVACSALLLHYGGHAAAGGFSVKEGCLDAFRGAFAAACALQASVLPAAAGDQPVDAWVEASDLPLPIVERIQQMAPFGEGNPEPVFAARGVRLADVRPLGADGRHLQVSFRDGYPRAVWWSHGDQVERLRADAGHPYDIRFTVEVSTYGEPHVELRLLDLRPSVHYSRAGGNIAEQDGK